MSGWERVMITSSSNQTGIEQQLTQPIETEPRALDELSTLHVAVVETSPEQPTQPIDTKLQESEELSTTLLDIVAKSPEQQPIQTKQETTDEPSTLSLAVAAKLPEQQPTQPMPSKRFMSVWRGLLPTLLCVLLIGGVLRGRAALTHGQSAVSHPAQTPFIIPSHHIYTH